MNTKRVGRLRSQRVAVTQTGESRISPTLRNRIYEVIPAVIALVTFYGLMSDGEAQLWAALIVAVLGGGGTLLARAYTPSSKG
ncbi:hypothetical protein VR010_14920 [Actinomycetaceae bacterium L2_0104]